MHRAETIETEARPRRQRPAGVAVRGAVARFSGQMVSGLIVCLLAFAAPVLPAQPQLAATRRQPERTREEVIANFLMNCLHYGDWSRAGSTNTPSPTIAIIGEDRRDALREALDAIMAKAPPGQVRYQVVRADSIEELQDCRVAILTSAKPSEVAEQVRQLKSRQLLLVGETDGFLELGGAVEFKAPPGGKLRFQVNLDHLDQIRVRFSSTFLKYAAGFLHAGRRQADFPTASKP